VVPSVSPEAQRGIDVHDFCMQFYDHVTVSGSKFEVDEGWLEKQLLGASEVARPFIENFVKFEEDRWRLCVQNVKNGKVKRYFLPVLREQKIVNLGLEITGVIDRVDLNFDGKTYTVVEYKTEKFDQRGWKLTEHRREMAFYKMLLENSNCLKGEVTHFCIYYPRSNEVWVEKFDPRTISSLKKTLSDVRRKIERGEFPCKVSYYCRYCEVNSYCSFNGDE
jgi:CRISPR/Cas system-associated exonuclease Cas4 (RecB family)